MKQFSAACGRTEKVLDSRDYRGFSMRQLYRFKWVFALFCFSLCVSGISRDRPKIGLVLSGGGARGFAHIGTLKMIDSLQIPIDYIVGTSMGGILGALYSTGYTGEQLEQLALRSDWEEIFTDRPGRSLMPYFLKKETERYQMEFVFRGLIPIPASGLVFGQKVVLMLSGLLYPYESVQDFDDLPIPYRCTAVNLRNGNEVILSGGSLVRAVRSTMSIPTLFSPVKWGDSLLVDGGLINNLPVDVAKAMGADLIIAVDVVGPNHETAELVSAVDVLSRSISILGIERWKKNSPLADVLIQPDLKGFSILDFFPDRIRRIIERGETAARECLADIEKIKREHGLMRFVDPDTLPMKVNPKIFDIEVTGCITLSPEEIIRNLKIRTGDILDLEYLKDTAGEMKQRGLVEDIHYEVIPLSDRECRLFLRVLEHSRPMIHGITIQGNEKLPFSFIYRLLEIEPGTRLDIDRLNQKIMEIYGLDYFETIFYDVEPAGRGRVLLHFQVKELPDSRLKMGIRYDGYHQMVMALNVVSNHFIVPGTRSEHELQIAGLTRFHSRTYYPGRTLKMPLYPFVQTFFKSIPVSLHNERGKRVAEYRDRGGGAGAGLGFLLSRGWNAEIGYEVEWMGIRPVVDYSDPRLIDRRNVRIGKWLYRMDLDYLDRRLIPEKGLHVHAEYENASERSLSNIDYYRMVLWGRFYIPVYSRLTCGLAGYWGRLSDDAPVYKYHNVGRPEWFLGAGYDQIMGHRLELIRGELRAEVRKNLYFSLIGTVCWNARFNTPALNYEAAKLYGAGAGLLFYTPLGTAEFYLARGPGDLTRSKPTETRIFIRIGTGF